MAALFQRECEVFMGSVDVERQSLNVFRMKPARAESHRVEGGAEPEGRDERGHARLDRHGSKYLLLIVQQRARSVSMDVRDFNR